MNDRLKEYRESLRAMQRLTDPLKEYRESITAMQHLADPFKEYRESITVMQHLADPLKEYRESITAMQHRADPLKEYRESFKSLFDHYQPARQLRDAFNNIHSTSEYYKPLSSLRELITDVNRQIQVDSSGSISLSTTRITASELQALANDVIDRATKKTSQTIDEAVNRLIAIIESQKDPLLQKILIWFIYPLIVGIIVAFVNPMAVLYVKSKYAPRNKELAKQLTSIKSDNDQPNQLAAFRFVSADSLIVRLKASKKSAPIGNLYFASVVILVEKKKNWSLVEWRDPDSGVSIKGWVFSRYLTKFK